MPTLDANLQDLGGLAELGWGEGCSCHTFGLSGGKMCRQQSLAAQDTENGSTAPVILGLTSGQKSKLRTGGFALGKSEPEKEAETLSRYPVKRDHLISRIS